MECRSGGLHVLGAAGCRGLLCQTPCQADRPPQTWHTAASSPLLHWGNGEGQETACALATSSLNRAETLLTERWSYIRSNSTGTTQAKCSCIGQCISLASGPLHHVTCVRRPAGFYWKWERCFWPWKVHLFSFALRPMLSPLSRRKRRQVLEFSLSLYYLQCTSLSLLSINNFKKAPKITTI